MIDYTEGYLGVHPNLIFRLRGSAVPKALLWAVPATLIAVGLFMFWGGNDTDTEDSVGKAWTAYTFVLGFAIVFRLDVSYSRFWEAVSLMHEMQGEWMDCYHSCCSMCKRYDELKRPDVERFKATMMRLMSMLHEAAICHLSGDQIESLPILDPDGLDPLFLDWCMGKDSMEILPSWIEMTMVDAKREGTIDVAAPIYSRAFNELSMGVVKFTELTKIRNHVLPFPIVQIIQYLMIFHAMMTPTIASLIMYNWRWAGTLAFSSVFSLWCINYMAMEIENPFGKHYNSLPVDNMQRNFNKCLTLASSKFLARPPKFTEAAFEGKISEITEITESVLLSKSVSVKAAGRRASLDSSERAAVADQAIRDLSSS